MSRRDSGFTSSDKSCWVSLVDYASARGVSLSTLRRHIKSGKILYKVQNGRYLISDDRRSSEDSSRYSPQHSNDLHADLMRARKEIAELKTLIALYEEKL